MRMSKKIYPYGVEPEAYPEYKKRWARAITTKELGNKIQFTTLRRFNEVDGRLVDFKDDLDIYTEQFKLGNVIWPFCSTLYAENFKELVDEIKRRGLYLFDFWGYVPGTNPEKLSWGNFRPPVESVEYMYNQLGGHFLGLDNGEQDGRYIGSYAPMMCPNTQNRSKQYINFCDYFDRLCDDMHHYLVALCSLNYGHYFAKRGDHIMLGAETAQALPNSNLWYAYLRGAGKQYGLLWFGNASVWNRWGWKNYSEEGDHGLYNEHGVECGTSLSLLRRLIYSHYMYNCEILGYESGWFYTEQMQGDKEGKVIPKLTPIGQLQHDAVGFTEKNGKPGILHTPIAILFDFYNGWTMPRHLYTRSIYRTWGNMPYEPGDYQAHALFSMLYPGYENSGFYRDERGFLTPTPYSDGFDVLFSDSRKEILEQYNTIVLVGAHKLNLETADKLKDFVNNGGHLIATIDQILDAKDISFFGLESYGDAVMVSNGEVYYKGQEYNEPTFQFVPIRACSESEIIASATKEKLPFIIRTYRGTGMIDLILSPYGLNDLTSTDTGEESIRITNGENEDIPMPFDLLDSVKDFLGDCFRQQQLIEINNDRLQYSINILEDEDALQLFICNNNYNREYFDIISTVGDIERIDEIELPSMSMDTPGYYPKVVKELIESGEFSKPKGTGTYSIEGTDIKLYKIWLQKMNVIVKEKIDIEDKSIRRMISLHNLDNLRNTLLTMETLDQYFSGINIDAEYLSRLDIRKAKSEGAYFKRTKLNMAVDFTSLLNFYPKLTIVDNIPERYQESLDEIKDVFEKMSYYGATKAIFSLHRMPENFFSEEQTYEAFLNNYREIANIAEKYDIIIYIENNPWKLRFSEQGRMDQTIQFIDELGVANVMAVLNLSHVIASEEDSIELLKRYSDTIGIIKISAPAKDVYGQLYDTHNAIKGSKYEDLVRQVIHCCDESNINADICYDAIYKSWDEVYEDIRVY